MKPVDPVFTRQDMIEGVLVVGFVDEDPGWRPRSAGEEAKGLDPTRPAGRIIRLNDPEPRPENPLVAELKSRLALVGQDGTPPFVVVDYANSDGLAARYDDNYRPTSSVIIQTDRRLKAQGGGLFICDHPCQFNPDLRTMFGWKGHQDHYKTRREALDAVHARRKNEAGSSGRT